MDARPAFVPHGQAAHAGKPCQGALDDPAVTAQPFAALDASAGNARLNTALAASAAAALGVIRLVGVQFAWPLARPAAPAFDGRYPIEQFSQGHAVMHIGARQHKGQGQAASVGQHVALCARLASVRRIRACGRAPLFAGMDALSIQARLQSMRPAQCRRCSSSWCRRLHTPATCQSRKRRQHVTPEPQPISWGSISQGMPERSTNRMPVSAARSDTRGRPPFGLGGSAGSNGWTMDQSSSVTSALFMPPSYGQPDQFLGFERHSKLVHSSGITKRVDKAVDQRARNFHHVGLVVRD